MSITFQYVKCWIDYSVKICKDIIMDAKLLNEIILWTEKSCSKILLENLRQEVADVLWVQQDGLSIEEIQNRCNGSLLKLIYQINMKKLSEIKGYISWGTISTNKIRDFNRFISIRPYWYMKLYIIFYKWRYLSLLKKMKQSDIQNFDYYTEKEQNIKNYSKMILNMFDMLPLIINPIVPILRDIKSFDKNAILEIYSNLELHITDLYNNINNLIDYCLEFEDPKVKI